MSLSLPDLMQLTYWSVADLVIVLRKPSANAVHKLLAGDWKTLPRCRVGRELCFKRTDVQAFVESRRDDVFRAHLVRKRA